MFQSDLISAYGLSTPSDSNSLTDLFNDLSKKPLFPIIEKVWKSDRYPYTIITHAEEIGMYIPYNVRYGYKAYEFFMENIRYYEETFNRQGKIYSSKEEIYLTKDRLQLLMQFRDDEIFQSSFIRNPFYTNRKDMLINFIEDNITNIGEFFLECNFNNIYSNQVKLITYVQGNTCTYYSMQEILDSKIKFPILSLTLLQRRIIQKVSQWRNKLIPIPNEILTFSLKLNNFLNK